MKTWRLIVPMFLLASLVILPYARASAQSPPPPPAISLPWQAHIDAHGTIDKQGLVGATVVTWKTPAVVPVTTQRVVVYRYTGNAWRVDHSANIKVHYTDVTYATVEGLVAAAAYRFAISVQLQGGTTIESLLSAAFTPTTAVPGDPIDLSGTPGNGSVTLTWLPRLGADIDHYLVQISTTRGDLVQYMDGVLNPPVHITGLTNGTTYVLAVRLVDSHGMMSVGSSVEAIPQAPTPSPVLTANRSSIEPGDSVALTGTNFPAGAAVTIALGTTSSNASGNYGTTTASSNGSFTISVTLSRYADNSPLHAGPIFLVAHTASWDAKAVTGVQVVTLTANKTTMHPGDHVVLTGQGFAPGMWLTIGMGTGTAPVSGTYASVLPDAAGNFSVDLVLTRYPDGTWLHAGTIIMQAHNADSSQKASTRIQVVSAPVLTPNKTAIRPGGTVTLTGEGFTPGSSITVSMRGLNGIIGGNYGAVLTDASGHFVITVVLDRYPDGTALRPGTILLQAHNANSSETATTQIQVLASPSLTANQTTFRPGDRLTLTGDGFSPGAPVTIGIGTVATGLSGNYGTVVPDANGHFVITVLVDRYPNGTALQAGAITLTAHTADFAEMASIQMQVVREPGQPTAVSAQIVNGQVVVTWTAPGNGGSAITSYRITAYVGSTSTIATVLTVAPSSNSAVMLGLSSGVTYTFTVAAINALGTSPESTRSSAVTMATVPGAVRTLTASGTDGGATVTWSAPATNGGAAITGYQVTANDGVHAPTVIVVTSTSATLTGLTNGSAYIVSVVAMNVAGKGAPASAVVVPRNLPPSLVVPGSQSLKYGEPVSLAVSATDPDAADHLAFSATGLPSGMAFADTGNRTGTITGSTQVPSGDYPITLSVSDGRNAAVTQSFIITVIPQDAAVQPTGIPTTVKVKSAAASAGAVTLHAMVRHATPGSLGNLAHATPVVYSLKPMGSSTTYNVTARTALSADGLATTATFKNLPVGVYRVSISVGGAYYTGAGYSVFSVVSPLKSGSVRGSGSVMTYGVTGDLKFNVKVLTNGKLQSSFRYVHHEPSGDFTLSSSAVRAVVVKGNKVFFQGTGSLNGVSGHRFAVAATDKGSPALTDRFALWLVDPGAALVGHCTFSAKNVSGGDMVIAR